MSQTVTFKGETKTLAGTTLKVGDKAPEFQCLDGLSPVKLADTPAKARLFSVVPSLDTGVCSMQTKKFDEALAAMKDTVASYTVSLDLPFAQKRFCTAEGVANMKTLSDVHNHSFGMSYGVLLEGLPLKLLARAVFVVDANNVIRYAEIVPEVTNHPNYDAALAALQAAV
ncbi:MAG: thiol peroxidase [Gemmataceae bacterium]